MILLVAAAMAALGALAILAWLLYTAYLNRRERRLAARKGPYRDLVASLAARERELLEPAIHQLRTYRDLEALEAALEEQARASAERPAWLLDAYDRLGLVDRYADRLRSARRWRDRAFAAELLGRVGNARAVPALLETVQATKREDADVREIALRALARIGDPRAVPALVAALRSAETWLAPRIADILARHGDGAVPPMIEFLEEGGRHHARAWAANVLGEVRAQRAFPMLVRALGDIDDEVRAKSAYALGRLGDSRAIPSLLEHLLTDPAPFVRARIAGALGQFDDPDVIGRLVRSLGDPAWWVRMRSVEALEQIGPQAEAPLLVALDDPDPELRMRSAVALERLGVPARAVRMIEDGDRPEEAREILTKFSIAGARELLAEQLLHPSAKVRLATIAAIRRTGRRELERELIEVARGDDDPMLRAAAFDTLRALGYTAAVPAALAAVTDPHDAVRTEAIHLLGELGDPSIAAELRATTSDGDPGPRAAAARALARTLGARAVPDLARLVTDPAPPVRAAAVDAAAEATLDGFVPSLLPLLADSDERVRIAAALALGGLATDEAADPMIRALDGASPALRDAIMVALTRLDPDAARRLFAARIEDPDPEARAAAIRGLARVGGGRAETLAEESLGDPADVVRAAALDAVVGLGDATQAPRILDLLGHDPSPLVRERAALAAGILRVPGAERRLAHACADGQPAPVRAAAVLALGAFGHESIAGRVAEMTDDADVRDVLRERLRDDDGYRRLAAELRQSHSLELRTLASPSRLRMEEALAEGMRSVLDPRERMRVVTGLRSFQGERSRSALLQAVRGDPSPEVRATALESVADLLDAETRLVTARRALGDPSLKVRRAAVTVLRTLPSADALPALVQSLRPDDDATLMRAAAVQAEGSFERLLALAGAGSARDAIVVTRLARFIHDPRLPQLLTAAARHDDPAVREALGALLAARPELAAEELVRALTVDPVIGVRRQALRAAAAAGLHVPLAAMADDPDPDVRRELATLLRTVPDGGTLARLADDVDPRVRAAAAVSALLRGELTALPAGVSHAEAAEAVVDAGDLADLRQAARTSPDERHRLAAALALGLVGDQVAREVAESDPVRSVRERVSALLDATP
jgi:HEAT repeat protein